jgi:hypothetical protein
MTNRAAMIVRPSLRTQLRRDAPGGEVQAGAMLLAREAGLDVPVHEDLSASLAERDYLERSIGRAGLLALQPLQVTGRRDRWHRHVLGQRRSTR